MKNKRGVTLISLVITIIILIILAGVAISLSLGENGIFSKAKWATQSYANEQAKEETQIAEIENEIYTQVNGNRGTVTISEEEYEILKNDNSYSTTEKKIGTWIDGKDLYKKAVKLTTPTTNAAWGECFTISDADTIMLKYFAAKSSHGWWYPFSNRDDGYQVSINGNKVQFWSNQSEYLGKEFIAIVEYTKTTNSTSAE